MPRQARLDIPGALHHIMVRGINKADIFDDDQDRALFLERLGKNVTEGKCTIYAWVLMSNHVHILFKSGREGISSVMRKLLTWYAQYYNRRHNRSANEDSGISDQCHTEHSGLNLICLQTDKKCGSNGVKDR